MSTTAEQRDSQNTGARPPSPYRPIRQDYGRQFGSAVANTAAAGEIAVREQVETLQRAIRRRPLPALVAALGTGWAVGRILAIVSR